MPARHRREPTRHDDATVRRQARDSAAHESDHNTSTVRGVQRAVQHSSATPAQILGLQRSVGNRAVQRLVAFAPVATAMTPIQRHVDNAVGVTFGPRIQRARDEVMDNLMGDAAAWDAFKTFADERFTPESYKWPVAMQKYGQLWAKMNHPALVIAQDYGQMGGSAVEDSLERHHYPRGLFDTLMTSALKTKNYGFFQMRQQYQRSWDFFHEHVQSTYDQLLADSGNSKHFDPVLNVSEKASNLVRDALARDV